MIEEENPHRLIAADFDGCAQARAVDGDGLGDGDRGN